MESWILMQVFYRSVGDVQYITFYYFCGTWDEKNIFYASTYSHLLQNGKPCDYTFWYDRHTMDIGHMQTQENRKSNIVRIYSQSKPRMPCIFVGMGYLAHFPLDRYTWYFIVNAFHQVDKESVHYAVCSLELLSS